MIAELAEPPYVVPRLVLIAAVVATALIAAKRPPAAPTYDVDMRSASFTPVDYISSAPVTCDNGRTYGQLLVGDGTAAHPYGVIRVCLTPMESLP